MAIRWPFARRRAQAPGGPGRLVVVDVEATGLDARRDRLVAIAAVAVHGAAFGATPRVVVADSFEVVVRQDAAPASRAAILVHGIGLGEQARGSEPGEALRDFAGYVDGAPLFGFHVAFDRMILERAMHGVAGVGLAGPWVDIEPLAAIAVPKVHARSLDDWLDHFGIRCLRRHQAAADALATAELLLRIWPALRRTAGDGDAAALARLVAERRWLAPGGVG